MTGSTIRMSGTTKTNANGNVKIITKNASGQVIRIDEPEGAWLTHHYDGIGNLIKTVVGGITTIMDYDIRGNKIAMSDPDMGQWFYTYNALGELISQTDAKGQVTTMTYDKLGRMLSRTEAEGVSTWAYDTSDRGIGKIASVTAPQGYGEDYLYDTLGRVQSVTTHADNQDFTISNQYDAFSRLGRQTRPENFVVENVYNDYGYLMGIKSPKEQISDYDWNHLNTLAGAGGTHASHYQEMAADTNNVYLWRATERDAAGRLAGHIVGNGLFNERSYNPNTGHLLSIRSRIGSSGEIRNLAYQYDKMDNVLSRQNSLSGLTENFTYDQLDRLTQSAVSGTIAGVAYNNSINYGYDINGNILHKSDMGDYTYGVNHPHAPSSIAKTQGGTLSYTYDANGSITQSGDKSITWTSFNKPSQFTKGVQSTLFSYGPDRARFLKVQTGSGVHIRTNYVGKLYEKITDSSVAGNTKTSHKHFIYADGKLIATHTKATSQSDKTLYLHYDNLGSIYTVTDTIGNLAEQMSYEAFGARRLGDWRSSATLIIPETTNRGFTGHEHIDEMGFIHMNGRVYDPSIGRFLSADPFIQDPYNTQSYNRYSYAVNNPLKYVDPSGHFFGALIAAISFISSAISGAVAAIGTALGLSATAATALGTLSVAVVKGAAIGFAVGAATTRSLKGALNGALMGGLSAGFAHGIGHIAINGVQLGGVSKVVAHGISQGATSEIMGGSFKDGFIGGAVGSIAGGMMGKGGGWDAVAKRTAIAATAGGVVTELGGGKFANGAMSAAFVHLFNDEDLARAFGADSPYLTYGVGLEGDLYASGAELHSYSPEPSSIDQSIETFLNANKTLESRMELYKPYLATRVDQMGRGLHYQTSLARSRAESLGKGFASITAPHVGSKAKSK